MEIEVRQNPRYGEHSGVKKYEVSVGGRVLGARNKNGIIAQHPDMVRIDKTSFGDKASLSELTQYLGRRNIEFVFI